MAGSFTDPVRLIDRGYNNWHTHKVQSVCSKQSAMKTLDASRIPNAGLQVFHSLTLRRMPLPNFERLHACAAAQGVKSTEMSEFKSVAKQLGQLVSTNY